MNPSDKRRYELIRSLIVVDNKKIIMKALKAREGNND
jgi:hypothetical protein